MNARARRLAPFAGYLMIAFVLAAVFMAQSPDSNASGAKVIAFFSHHKNSVHAQDLFLAYAALAAILYFASVATYLRSRGSQILATTAVAGSIVMAAGFCVGAGVNETLADKPSELSAASAQTLNVLSNDVFGVLLIAGVALATLSMGVAMLRTKAVPTALGVVTTVVGVACTLGPVGWIGFLATGPLTLVVAAYVYARTAQPTEITLPDSNAEIPAQATTTRAASRSKATTG